MQVAIIDSGGANIGSVRYALERLGVDSVLTRDWPVIQRAARVILPGVGAAAVAMARLRDADLARRIGTLQQPVLGICLGMQLLFDSSDEGGTPIPMLGIIPGKISAITRGTDARGATLRVPHMGWNTLEPEQPDPIMDALGQPPWMYFVHGYAAPISAHTLASVDYGQRYSALVRKDNFYGAQFHPERSAGDGARLLDNFIKLTRAKE